MATGDMQGNVDRLRLELRSVRYNEEFDVQGLRDGNPAAFLPLLHYCLLGYSRLLARHLSGLGYELYAKSDLRFVESVFKILRDEFSYRSSLTIAQFLSRGFAERKLILLYDVVQLCKKKHNELWKDSQPSKVHKVYKSPPTEEREANVRVVRETPLAGPASTSNQASSSTRGAPAKTETVEPDAGGGSNAKVAALAARFRSPTEPPPLPQALQKQRQRVVHPTREPSFSAQPSSSTRPQNPPFQTSGPSGVRATSTQLQTSSDTNRGQVDGSSRPMSDILHQFGGAANGADRPQVSFARVGDEHAARNGGPDQNQAIPDGVEGVENGGDEERKEMSGVEPSQLVAALRKQFDSSGDLVDAERRHGQDDPARAGGSSSDEDGPLSSERVQQLVDRNDEKVEELKAKVHFLEEKYDKMEQEALKVKENLQAKITLLEGRVRFLEAAQADKAKGSASSQQKGGPSSAGSTLIRQTSLPRRATSQGQPAAPSPHRSIRDLTNTEKTPPPQKHNAPSLTTSPIKANRGTKDFIEKMRARFEATQKMLQESDKMSI